MRSIMVFWLLALSALSWGRPAAGTPASGAPSSGTLSSGAAKASAARPAPLPASPSRGLDTARIHALYMDGEFDLALGELEQARKRNLLRTRADSLFAFKHLAVMYAATYATVEKGKQYMVQLLTLDPAAGILDMQASDMIYMLFRNVQTELAHARHKPDTAVAITPPGDTASEPPRPRDRPGRSRWPYWTAGTVALAVGAGAVLYFTVFDDEPKDGKKFKGGL